MDINKLIIKRVKLIKIMIIISIIKINKSITINLKKSNIRKITNNIKKVNK